MALGRTYSPFSDEHVANPYPFYARARSEEPVFFSEEQGFWVVSRYETVMAVLKDHRRFVVNNPDVCPMSPEVKALLGDHVMVPSLQELEPPKHTLLRGTVMNAFSPRRVAALEPVIRGFADRLIDRLGGWGEGDFVKLFAEPFPMMVIAHVLDVPEHEQHCLQRWSDDVLALMFGKPVDELALAKSALEFREHVYALVARRRAHPRDDVTSALARDLDDDRIAGLLQLLLAAGVETTVKLLGHTMRALLTEPRHWQAIVDSPEHIPAVVEEMLRFDAPVVSLIRQATEDVELDGHHIKRGQMVQVLLGSANHDEAVFADPETFCPSREPKPHLSLGAGAHFCLGAALGRLEMRIALEQLTARLPELRLLPQEISYLPNLNMRGLLGLRVAWGPAVGR